MIIKQNKTEFFYLMIIAMLHKYKDFVMLKHLLYFESINRQSATSDWLTSDTSGSIA